MRFPTFSIHTAFFAKQKKKTILKIRYKTHDLRVVVPSGVWYHLAISLKNDGIITYVNGEERVRNIIQDKELPTQMIIRVNNVASICLDELLISSVDMPGTEVQKLYDSYLTGSFTFY